MAAETGRCLDMLKAWGASITAYRPVRVCVPGPETLRLLRKRIKASPQVELLEDVLVTGLLREAGRVSGALALDLATGEFLAFRASAVVLATGGFTGELYPRTSNNPFGVSTGASATGHMMAFRSGADLIDPEMIQFVPVPADDCNLNLRYFPDFFAGPYENKAGDVVESSVDQYPGGSYSWQIARKIARETAEGRGPVSIDQRGVTTPLPGGMVKTWDNRRRLISAMGIDPREHKFRIALGSHFCMGGLRVNERTESTLPGLYAAGEIMGGLHGALRIPGYSFTQMIVFGIEAGRQAAAWALHAGRPGSLPGDEIEAGKEQVFRFLSRGGKGEPLKTLKARLQEIMERRVFVERDRAGLERALSEIGALQGPALAVRVPGFRRFNLEWARAIEFPFLVEAARVVAEGALLREETRGFHYRTDFPQEDNEQWLCHTMVKLDQGRFVKGTVPVNLTWKRPEKRHG